MTELTSDLHLVIAGGGTGGHLFPGVAVAEEFTNLVPDSTVTFVGTESGIESRVIPDTPFDLELVEVQALKGGSLFRRAASLVGLPGSGLKAHRLLNRLEPDVVVSVGGYAAGPVTLVAAVNGIPTALMEQNSYPGLTNRLLSRFVDRAFLTFEASAEHLTGAEPSVVGNPVRRPLLEQAGQFDYEPPRRDGPFHILVIGGSGGAGSFNEHLPRLFGSMGDFESRLHIRHQAGKARSGEAEPGYRDFAGQAEVVEFIDDMAAAYRWCDLLVCRAGASTIAEVLTLGIPSVLVPFPDAADDHQRANARSVVEAGGAVMIDDHQIVSDRARNLLTGLMNNPESLANLAAGARTQARPDAGRVIAEALRDLAADGR